MHDVATQSDATFTTAQIWSDYSDEDHRVWSMLYRRRMAALRGTGSRIFLDGADTIGLRERAVPRLSEVNTKLQALTGWEAVAVTGFLPAPEFFACLAQRRFPTTVVIRDMKDLDYVEAPDIFHDVFGHVPLHADPVFAAFLQQFGERAASATNDRDVERMARLFWFTVEFGLIREVDGIRVYGSGLISSAADAANALGPECDRRPFDLDAVFDQPFDIDRLQDVLFVIDSFDQLYRAVDAL